MQILKLAPGDLLLLKKPHPCGGNQFRVLRVGSDVRMVCLTCGHDMTLDRVRLERAVKKRTPNEAQKEGPD